MGVLHVATEIVLSPRVARQYNAVATAAILLYLGWRLSVTQNALHMWGFRGDNFWAALRLQLTFAVPAGVILYGLGLSQGTATLPRTFWLVLGLYPLWGIAQQFALQNLIARNLRDVVPDQMLRALAVALLFGLSHCPRRSLMVLTFVAGFFLTLIYEYQPNLWAVGCVHGVLGAMTIYIVLQEDPGAKFLGFVQDRCHKDSRS